MDTAFYTSILCVVVLQVMRTRWSRDGKEARVEDKSFNEEILTEILVEVSRLRPASLTFKRNRAALIAFQHISWTMPVAEASTEYEVLESFGGEGKVVLLEALPRTGRTHQIRAHLSGIGWPLVGDPIYGGHVATESLVLLKAVFRGCN